jgi:hypothetical protein
LAELRQYEENPIFAKKYFHTLGYENIGCFSLMNPDLNIAKNCLFSPRCVISEL